MPDLTRLNPHSCIYIVFKHLQLFFYTVNTRSFPHSRKLYVPGDTSPTTMIESWNRYVELSLWQSGIPIFCVMTAKTGKMSNVSVDTAIQMCYLKVI